VAYEGLPVCVPSYATEAIIWSKNQDHIYICIYMHIYMHIYTYAYILSCRHLYLTNIMWQSGCIYGATALLHMIMDLNYEAILGWNWPQRLCWGPHVPVEAPWTSHYSININQPLRLRLISPGFWENAWSTISECPDSAQIVFWRIETQLPPHILPLLWTLGVGST